MAAEIAAKVAPGDPPGRAGLASYESVFAIFQGGGAKGITHIGALKAMEEERLVTVGVAGTSAGAIVAALVAVGYTADQILDPDARETILGGASPVLWLGAWRWRCFRLLRRAGPHLLGAAAAALEVLAALLAFHARGQVIPAWTVAATLAMLLGALLLLAALALPPLWRRGLFASGMLRDLVNEKLRDKLRKHYEDMGDPDREPPSQVTFADIDSRQVPACRPLKIVVTDIRGRELVLFDGATPCAVVADAVVASAAIPGAFAPPTVAGWVRGERQMFADGGLVSNLPSWVFTVEKRALERQQAGAITTLAFSLEPKQRDPQSGAAPLPRPSLLAYARDVLSAGIFGSQTIVGQFVADLHAVPLPTSLGTLDFDCGWDRAVTAHREGLEAARLNLSQRRGFRDIETRLLRAVLAQMNEAIAARRSAGAMPRLRVSLVDPSGPKDRIADEFKVVAGSDMAGDADDRLPLDPRNPAAPRAFAARTTVFTLVRGLSTEALAMTKYERALVWPDLCSIIAVPVFGKPPPPGTPPPPTQRVLCLDSSDDLRGEFDDPIFMARLEQLSYALSRTWIREQLSRSG